MVEVPGCAPDAAREYVSFSIDGYDDKVPGHFSCSGSATDGSVDCYHHCSHIDSCDTEECRQAYDDCVALP